MSFENPKITVVGAGAMGGLFGGLLAEGGLDVTLVDAWPEHVAAIKADGLRIVGVGGDRAIKVEGDDRRGRGRAPTSCCSSARRSPTRRRRRA